jgi:xanthine dehydrogenase accessory factor
MVVSVLVLGIGDVGSAVAWVLFKAGRSVILDGPTPVTHRRMMGFADAMFDGEAVLEGVTARRCQTLAQVTLYPRRDR